VGISSHLMTDMVIPAAHAAATVVAVYNKHNDRRIGRLPE